MVVSSQQEYEVNSLLLPLSCRHRAASGAADPSQLICHAPLWHILLSCIGTARAAGQSAYFFPACTPVFSTSVLSRTYMV